MIWARRSLLARTTRRGPQQTVQLSYRILFTERQEIKFQVPDAVFDKSWALGFRLGPPDVPPMPDCDPTFPSGLRLEAHVGSLPAKPAVWRKTGGGQGPFSVTHRARTLSSGAHRTKNSRAVSSIDSSNDRTRRRNARASLPQSATVQSSSLSVSVRSMRPMQTSICS